MLFFFFSTWSGHAFLLTSNFSCCLVKVRDLKKKKMIIFIQARVICPPVTFDIHILSFYREHKWPNEDNQNSMGKLYFSTIFFWGKWVFVPNLWTIQQNIYILKLFSKIFLFLKFDFNKIELCKTWYSQNWVTCIFLSGTWH